MSRGRHCKPSAMRRGLTVAAVGAATVALTSGMAVASTPAQSLDCADANLAYSQAAAHEQDTSKALADAKAADAAAIDKRDTAVTEATAKFKAGQPYATPKDREAAAKVRDAAIAAARAEYAKGGTADKLNAAQAAENSALADRDAKHDAANTACKGADGKDGTSIVDTIVALRPGACVRAQVRKDTNKIVRVIVAVPCPTKPAPPAQASESTSSTTVTPAPVPQTQEMNGTAPTVTH